MCIDFPVYTTGIPFRDVYLLPFSGGRIKHHIRLTSSVELLILCAHCNIVPGSTRGGGGGGGGGGRGHSKKTGGGSSGTSGAEWTSKLLRACADGNLHLAKECLEHGADIAGTARPHARSPLREAAGFNHVDVVEYLISKGSCLLLSLSVSLSIYLSIYLSISLSLSLSLSLLARCFSPCGNLHKLVSHA